MDFHVTKSVDDIKESLFFTYGNVKTSKKKDTRLRIVLSIFFAIVWLLLFLNPTGKKLDILWLIGIVAAMLGFIVVLMPLLTRVTIERKIVKSMLQTSQQAVITVDETGVRTVSDDANQNMIFAWKNINQLIISDNVYTFIADIGLIIFFNKQYVDEQELNKFITKHLAEDKVILRKYN